MKKAFTFCLILLSIFCFVSCSSNTEFTSTSKGISFEYSKDYTPEETENYILLDNTKEGIQIIITSTDVLHSVSDEYRQLLEITQIDIQCGAFNSTYNNYIYAGELFAYLTDGNENGLAPTWIDKTTIGTENYFAYYSALEGEDNCGLIYETVQNGKLYIICIYIDDSYDDIFDYTEKTEEIISSISFSE